MLQLYANSKVQHMRIFILEDSQERIKQFNRAFIGHELFITDNATVAINKLKSQKFDLIFLDHDLNGLQMEWREDNNGLMVAREIPSTKNCDSMTIIHSCNTPAAIAMKGFLPHAHRISFVMLNLDHLAGQINGL